MQTGSRGGGVWQAPRSVSHSQCAQPNVWHDFIMSGILEYTNNVTYSDFFAKTFDKIDTTLVFVC